MYLDLRPDHINVVKDGILFKLILMEDGGSVMAVLSRVQLEQLQTKIDSCMPDEGSK